MSAIGRRIPHRADRTTDREDGFTLIEALAAVAVMGLISGLIFPALTRATQSFAASQAAAELGAAARLTRAQAMRTGQPVTFGGLDNPPAGVRQAMTGGPVTFFADGSATGAQFLFSAGRRRAAISIDPASGVPMRTEIR